MPEEAPVTSATRPRRAADAGGRSGDVNQHMMVLDEVVEGLALLIQQ
jgi:hypothetical protein